MNLFYALLLMGNKNATYSHYKGLFGKLQKQDLFQCFSEVFIAVANVCWNLNGKKQEFKVLEHFTFISIQSILCWTHFYKHFLKEINFSLKKGKINSFRTNVFIGRSNIVIILK